jgi:hypothetical protein
MTIQCSLEFSVYLFVCIQLIIRSYAQTIFRILIRLATQVFSNDNCLPNASRLMCEIGSNDFFIVTQGTSKLFTYESYYTCMIT